VVQGTLALTRERRSKKTPNQRPSPLEGRGRDIKARAKVPTGGNDYMVANENFTYQHYKDPDPTRQAGLTGIGCRVG